MRNSNQQEQYLRRSTWDCRRERKITDKVIINTQNEKLDLDIKLRDIERKHRIGEPKKNRGKNHPIIVKFVR